MKKFLLSVLGCFIIMSLRAHTIKSNPGSWDWNNAAAWVNGSIPNADDDVIISNGSIITLNIKTSINSITISSVRDSSSSLIIHEDIFVKKSIYFISSYFNDKSTLLVDDTVPRKVYISEDFNCSYGAVSIINAEHILELQGNFNTGYEFQDFSGIIKITGTGYNTFFSGGSTIFKMEIGDGVHEKVFECIVPSYEIRFRKNGYLQVNKSSTFYFNGKDYWNSNAAPGVSLNILNGATVYTSGKDKISGYNLLAKFTYFNKDISEDSVKTGTLYLTGVSGNNIPSGTIGNLIAEDPHYGIMILNINGIGIRSLNILGNLSFVENECIFGDANANDRGNVTIHFKGTTNPVNTISFRNGGSLTFGDFSSFRNPINECKVLISGNYEIVTIKKKGDAGFGDIRFYDLVVADGASLHLRRPSDNFNIEARGNLTIGKNSLVDFKSSQNVWFLNGTRNKNSIYSGEGTLRVNDFKASYSQSPGIEVSLKNVEIYPYGETYSYLSFEQLSWIQTAGRFYISYPYKDRSFFLSHFDPNSTLTFNDLQVGKNTNLSLGISNDLTLTIKGNLKLDDSASFKNNDNSTTDFIEFSGSTTQTITSSKSSELLYIPHLRINNAKGLTLNCDLIIAEHYFSGQTPTLDLNNNSIINISGKGSLTLKGSGTKQGQIINIGDSAFINGALKLITKSTENSSSYVIKNFTFPIGKVVDGKNIYAPITIKDITNHSEYINNDASDDDYFVAEYFYKPASKPLNLSDSLEGISNIEYWNVTKKTESKMMANITLCWHDKYRSFIENKGRRYLKVAQLKNGIWQNNGNDYQLVSKTARTIDSITSTVNFDFFGDITFGSTNLTINSLGKALKMPLQSYDTQQPLLCLYPNPSKTYATATFNITGIYELQVRNNRGSILQTKKGIAKGKTSITIDISDYSPGIYFITLKDEANKIQTAQVNKVAD